MRSAQHLEACVYTMQLLVHTQLTHCVCTTQREIDVNVYTHMQHICAFTACVYTMQPVNCLCIHNARVVYAQLSAKSTKMCIHKPQSTKMCIHKRCIFVYTQKPTRMAAQYLPQCMRSGGRHLPCVPHRQVCIGTCMEDMKRVHRGGTRTAPSRGLVSHRVRAYSAPWEGVTARPRVRSAYQMIESKEPVECGSRCNRAPLNGRYKEGTPRWNPNGTVPRC